MAIRRRSAAEVAALRRAKAVLDGMELYPRPVRLDHVHVLHVPWLFRLPWFRRFRGYEVGSLILLSMPLAEASNGLIAHELCHVWQCQHKPLRMPLSYLVQGYRDNPHEVEARAAAALARRGPAARMRSCAVSMSVFVCTQDRLARLRRDGGSWTAEPALEGAGARCVAAEGARVLVGTRGHGAMLSVDAGETWEQVELPERDIFSVAIGAADGALYAGSEPSRLFVARDGATWAELEALQAIPSRDRWSFPPRPWTHHVRWIAPDPHRAERLLVGIELGGVMYSDDGGATFSDHRPGAKLDAHSLAWHPRAEGRAYQAAGDGAAWSRDGGRTWEAADAGRELGYCWALAVDPGDPECWYVSAATGPRAAHSGDGARGRLYRWDGSWAALALPGDSMPYALAASDGELLAGMADGRLLRSDDGGESWEDIGVRLDSVNAMAVA